MKNNLNQSGINNIIAVLIIVVVVAAFLNFAVTIVKISDFKNKVTGLATSGLGYVNITILQEIAVNMSRNTVNWGAGIVNTTGGCLNATLITSGESASVTCGNWTTTNAKALIAENTGNVNFSLNISAGKNAVGFFGGTGPEYQWNITNKEAGACGEQGGTYTFGTWGSVNSSSLRICNKTNFDVNDELYIDFRLVIPSNVNGTIASGNLQSDTITLTAATAI